MMSPTHAACGALFAAAGGPAINQALDLGLTPAQLAVGVGIGTFAGLLPDIDHPESLVTKGKVARGRLWRMLHLQKVGIVAGQVFSIVPRIVGLGIRAVGAHRGPTHSLVFLALWTLLAAPAYAVMFGLLAVAASILVGAISGALLEPFFGVAIGFDPSSTIAWLTDHTPQVMPLVMLSVFLGYLSHLVADSCTNAPISLLWPIKPKPHFFLLPKGLRVKTDSVKERKLVRPVVTSMAILSFVFFIALPMVGSNYSDAKQRTEQVQEKVKNTVDEHRPSKKPTGKRPKLDL